MSCFAAALAMNKKKNKEKEKGEGSNAVSPVHRLETVSQV